MPICASCGRENPEDARFCMACATPLLNATAPRELRKTVTALFCDVVGSTALGDSSDPEAVRAVLARYFERMKGIVERHGGTVEKFIGDAVVAVFGVPVVHEDDALRACRAAIEMRDALPELGIECRFGVNTGEVVTTTDGLLASGDALNVAARLEQAAAPGEILVGGSTLALVRSAVEVEAVEPLTLKGKAEPVPASRLLAATGELQRRFATPMVGRQTELRRLGDAYSQAVRDRSCQLFTVLGSAGVGKSRLAAEFIDSVDARVVRGRCLSYGEGITYWPVIEVVKQLASLPEGDAAEPLRSLLGETQQATSADQIAWSFRKLLEQEAQLHPLVVVLDDLHWAEETLLDLVEHVADLSRDAPLLLYCMARPELLERRPVWGGGKWNATAVLLEPLDAGETDELIGSLGGVSAELGDRIVQVAEGNPLFLEEMLALVRASPDGHVEVPPTIQALLAARLDQLDPGERSVLERGSVEGRLFHRGAVAALTEDEPQVDERLLALVRKQLVRPDKPQLSSEDAYRFRHLLIRDAAYDALPKSVRADLHRRFAEWLEVHGRELAELEEILGYHLEQAALYLSELGRADEALAAAAAAKLTAAGRRAMWRLDRRAAMSLLQRALALTEDPDVHLVVALSRISDPRTGAELLDAAAERAERKGDAAGAALARAVAGYNRTWTGELSADGQEHLALAALPVLEAADDNAGLSEVWRTLAQGVYNVRCSYAQMEYASLEARRFGMLAGEPGRYAVLSVALTWGPRPAPDALRLLESVIAGRDRHPGIELDRAVLIAMTGRLDDARTIATAAEAELRELGDESATHVYFADIETIAGNHCIVADRLRTECDYMRGRGLKAGLGTYASMLGRALCALGEFDEAELVSIEGRDNADEDDPVAQALWRRVTALVLLERGSHAEAERLARDAVEWIARSDGLWALGDALSDLAWVLEAGGRREDAVDVLEEALSVFERKGIVPIAQRTRERLAALQPA